MVAFRAAKPTTINRKRILSLCLLAAGLGVLVWQRLPPTPRAREAARMEAAVRSIQAALKREPGCARAHLVAGEQWLRDDDLTHALADFREAARLAPASPVAFQRAGYILLDLDRPVEAEKVLLDGLRAGPDDIGLHVQLGRLYALRGTDRAALALAESHYLRALPGNPNAAVVKASLGEVAMQAGKPEEARRWWESALQENRNESK